MTQVLSFESAAGSVSVEIASSDSADGLGPAGFGRKAIIAAPLTFEQAIAGLRPTVQVISEQFKGLADPPEEIEVSFGLKITGSVNAGIISAGGESQLTVTLRWTSLSATTHPHR